MGFCALAALGRGEQQQSCVHRPDVSRHRGAHRGQSLQPYAIFRRQFSPHGEPLVCAFHGLVSTHRFNSRRAYSHVWNAGLPRQQLHQRPVGRRGPDAILGFSEIIARECLGPVGSPRYKEYAGDIHISGSHLLSLINDLLDVAKIEAGRMEVEPQMIETARCLDGALKFVGPKARERNQTLTITVDDAAAVLFADERALKQIVINLVTNSVKFTRNGGRIDVAARRNADGDFELTVTDNGAGVSKEKLDRIFKPFSRVDNRYD